MNPTWLEITSGSIHFITAVLALFGGAWLLITTKGTRRHRQLGRVWFLSMLVMNVSALCTYDISGQPNLFHALALLSLGTILPGYYQIQRFRQTGDRNHLVSHGIWMSWGYFGVANAGLWQLGTRLIDAFVETSVWQVVPTLVAITVVLAIFANGWISRRSTAHAHNA